MHTAPLPTTARWTMGRKRAVLLSLLPLLLLLNPLPVEAQTPWATEGTLDMKVMDPDYSNPQHTRYDKANNVLYFDDATRGSFKLNVGPDGKLYTAAVPNVPLDTKVTSEKPDGTKVTEHRPLIYVMDANGTIYVIHEVWIQDQLGGRKIHHSSIPAGQPVAAAGMMVIEDGKILMINNESGHYKPDNLKLVQMLENLRDKGYDLGSLRGKVDFIRHEYPGDEFVKLDPEGDTKFRDRLSENPKLAELMKPKVEGQPEDRRKEPVPEVEPVRAEGGSPFHDATLVQKARPAPPAPEPPLDQTDTYKRIKDLIEKTPADQMDAKFMTDIYQMDPKAAKMVGQIVGGEGMEAKNLKMGELRAQMDLDVWKAILKERNIRIEFTNQGKSNGIKSDLDYTLYYIAKETGIAIEDLVKEHTAKWNDLHKIRPDRVEIAVMDGDAFYPDWRNEALSADEYRVELKKNLIALRRNPEAYFVPGANKQQVHNRALRDGVTTILEYDAVKGELKVETGNTRDIALRYKGVHPQYDYRNALGNLIQNFREFTHHSGDNAQDAIRRAKYFNRVVNEGLGGLAFFANSYQEILQSNLPDAEKQRLLLGDGTPDASGKNPSFLRRAFANQNLGEADLQAFKKIIDVSMQIELDKVKGGVDYMNARAEYFKHYRAEAEAEVRAKAEGQNVAPAEMERLILAEQERLFNLDQKRVMARSLLAGLQHSARRDLTPAGAVRNALRYETDPETGRLKAVLDEERIKKVGTERAMEVMLLFEMINESNDPKLLELRAEVIRSAGDDSDLRRLYEHLSEVKTAQVDNFLKDPHSKIQMDFDDFLRRKLERVRAAGIPLASEAEAASITDEELRRHILEARLNKLNPAEAATFQKVAQEAGHAAGDIGREMYGKASGLMMGSSAVNLIQAYQTGDDMTFRRAIFSEAINYMPDVVEIPFTVLDAMWSAQKGDLSGFYGIAEMGALRFVPGVGQAMLVYNIGKGSFQIARTYAVSRINNDLLEQAFRSRPVDAQGQPLSSTIRARRNPYKDSQDLFRGDAPVYPIFYHKFSVPEDRMPDEELARLAAVEDATKIVKDLKDEGLEEQTPAWEERSRQLALKYGFDLPYRRRMEKVYAHFHPIIADYILRAPHGAEYIEEVALRKLFTDEMMAWFNDQPYGYQKEFEGYFDMFFGDGKQGLLDGIVAQLIGEYKLQETLELNRRAMEEQNAQAVQNQMAAAGTIEKQLLATEKKLQAQIDTKTTSKALELGRQAELPDYEPVVAVSYPFTYATEAHPPELDVTVRALRTEFKQPFKHEITEELGEPQYGAPGGWKPEPEWEQRFKEDDKGWAAYVPVTIEHTLKVQALDADDRPIGRAELKLPVVYYVPNNPPFAGGVTVEVKGATETGRPEDAYLYSGATVTFNDEERVTDPFGLVYFAVTEPGAVSVTAQPSPGDERHGEASGSANVVDTLATPGAGKPYETIEIVLPYKPPPTTTENKPDDETNAGQGNDKGGDKPGDDNDSGEAGGEGNDKDGDGKDDKDGDDKNNNIPTTEQAIQQLAPLTSEWEKRRDEAKAACKYDEAAAQQELVKVADTFVAQTFPGGVPAEITTLLDQYRAELAALQKASTAQEQARGFLRDGLTALQAKQTEPALDALEKAAAVPDIPQCLYDQIMVTYLEIKTDLQKRMEWIAQAVAAANDECDYKKALGFGEQVEALGPDLSWVKEELPQIRNLEQRQRQARALAAEAIQLAQEAEALGNGGDTAASEAKFEQALERAVRALEIAPECEKKRLEPQLVNLPQRKATTKQATTVARSVVFLLDTSGSMGSGNKMESAKVAASQAIKALGPDTEVAVLSFDGGCAGGWRVAHDFSTDKDAAVQAVAGLQPGGGTPMAPAIGFAQEYLEKSHNPGSGSGQIVLLGDGQNDCGSMTDAGNGVRNSSMNIRLDAVGLGLDGNAQAQKDLADLVRAAGNGQTYSANSSGELVKAFRRAFMADQLKKSDPYVDGGAGTSLSQLFATAIELMKQNDLDGATAAFSQAVTEYPNSPSAHFNVSLAYEATGKPLQAMNHARQYLALAPGAIDAETVRQRIALLEEEQQQNPRAIYDPNDCSALYRWAQRESRQVREADRKTLVYSIMTAAQRGACAEAEPAYEQYVQRYGGR